MMKQSSVFKQISVLVVRHPEDGFWSASSGKVGGGKMRDPAAALESLAHAWRSLAASRIADVIAEAQV